MSKISNTQFQMVADFDGDASCLYGEHKEGVYPILCTRNLVLFPTVVTPILVGREQSINVVKHMQKHEKDVICIFCQKNQDIDDPSLNDLYHIGVFAKVIRVMEMPMCL